MHFLKVNMSMLTSNVYQKVNPSFLYLKDSNLRRSIMLRRIKGKDSLKKLLVVIFLFLESCTTINLTSPSHTSTIVPTSFEDLVTSTSLEPIFQTKCAIEENQKIDIANNEILILRDNESIYELRLPDVSIVEESNRYDVVRSLGFHVSPNYKNIAFASSQNGLELVFSESYLKLVNKFS